MLFNSYVFIFVFLPIVLSGFYLIGQRSHQFASLWLAAASLFFYGWWDTRFVGLLLASIAFNYCAGYVVARWAEHNRRQQKWLLGGAITANLALLGYFKYANFFADSLQTLTGTTLSIGEIVLPLGISFYTFTQIAFLVDTYQGKVKEYRFIHYTLFITYFPHLIAGPVLHHKEMMPQFARPATCRLDWDNIATGLTIFLLGLGKKVLIADTLAEYATPVFQVVAQGGQPMLLEAWIGVLAYTMQLYFDFSAYSDMAIGISLLFNVQLPINFNSPYKSTSIIEFWRRWHMTLSRFLRDYLYIPLGGNQHGATSRYLNLMITMLLGGLWHGAGWTFVIWGGLHGCYLLINHAWRSLRTKLGWSTPGRMTTAAGGMLTFLAVVVGWVFFRADSASSAMNLLQAMVGIHGISLEPKLAASAVGNSLAALGAQFQGVMPLTELKSGKAFNAILIAMLIAFCLPNVQEIVQTPTTERKGLLRYMAWRPSWAHALLLLTLAYFVLTNLHRQSEFLYFQF
ncbi:MBOAT family O-acyltransferase [Chitinimonas sp. BJB300]|uniref:MBOAT family O-acyltransferase n=1 Tax=Chitinimonas sp. BJB300 TaxID=1559339 RepID=UPI000C107598|nr:MBOAT family protein [Chitinimonas sp. BJB300]PHV12282.1 membrane-bound O-acyltransferase family protein [Chitinimonas sp. BJB300]TSJ88143.1 MBOAT family protein [Chitinimonas sp. BJB300]